MDNQDYVDSLKKRQIEILVKYEDLLSISLEGDRLLNKKSFAAFRERETILIHKLEHLEKVIGAFPCNTKAELDAEIELRYRNARSKLTLMMERIQESKNLLQRRRSLSKLRNNRSNRLYREVNPSYIDIRT